MYAISYTADTEGNWCSSCEQVLYQTRELAAAALAADETAGPDEYGNRCYPEIVEVDRDGYDSPGRYLGPRGSREESK